MRSRSILPECTTTLLARSLFFVMLVGALSLVPSFVSAQYGSSFLRSSDLEDSLKPGQSPQSESAAEINLGKTDETESAPKDEHPSSSWSGGQDGGGADAVSAEQTGESVVVPSAEMEQEIEDTVSPQAGVTVVEEEGDDEVQEPFSQDEALPVDVVQRNEKTSLGGSTERGRFQEEEEKYRGRGDPRQHMIHTFDKDAENEDVRGGEKKTKGMRQRSYAVEESRETPEPEEREPVREESAGEAGKSNGVRICDPGGPLGVRAYCYEDPGQLLASPWMQIRRAVDSENVGRLQSAMSQIFEAKLDAGFPNEPAYATLLIREAYRLLLRKEFDSAELFGETACELAPDFYPAFDFMARLAKADPSQSIKKFLHWKWVALTKRAGHFAWQVRSLGKLYLVLVSSLYLFFLFLGLLLVVRYGRIFSHALRERMRSGPQGFFQRVGLLALGLLAMLLLPGFFWIVVFAGVWLGRYARRWEQALFLLLLVVSAFSPWLLHQAARFLSSMPEAVKVLNACTQDGWNPAFADTLDKALGYDPGSLDLLQAQALVKKRKGDYAEAIRILQSAIKTNPDRGALWNNLGNLFAIRGELPQAREAYRLAIRKDNRLASPHYNLSQLLRWDFDFIEGSREFERARQIDPARVDSFVYIHTQNANRFFMDEKPSIGSSWAYFMRDDSEIASTAKQLWMLSGTGVPLDWAPWVFLPLAGVYLILLKRRSGFEPFACSACGVVICPKCQPGTRAAGICTPCHQSLYQKDQVVKDRRNRQVREMVLHHTRRSRNLMFINLLFPGLGLSLQKERVWGMLVLFAFLFCTLIAVSWNRILPPPLSVWETGRDNVAIAMGSVLFFAYLGIQMHFLRKIRIGR